MVSSIIRSVALAGGFAGPASASILARWILVDGRRSSAMGMLLWRMGGLALPGGWHGGHRKPGFWSRGMVAWSYAGMVA